MPRLAVLLIALLAALAFSLHHSQTDDGWVVRTFDAECAVAQQLGVGVIVAGALAGTGLGYVAGAALVALPVIVSGGAHHMRDITGAKRRSSASGGSGFSGGGFSGGGGGGSWQPPNASLPAAARRSALREAVAAVDRPVSARLERYLGVLPALGAHRRVHLPGRAVASAAASAPAAASAALRLAGAPAVGAALGLAVPLHREELLVLPGEGELCAAVLTGEGSIGVCHLTTSELFCSWSSSEGSVSCRFEDEETGEILARSAPAGNML